MGWLSPFYATFLRFHSRFFALVFPVLLFLFYEMTPYDLDLLDTTSVYCFQETRKGFPIISLLFLSLFLSSLIFTAGLLV